MQHGLAFDSPPLRLAVLGSGSGGNAVVVDSCGRRLLLDAGFSCRELERRLRAVGVEPGSASAVLLTHEHGDHGRGAPRFADRHRIPLLATRGTLDGIRFGRHRPLVRTIAAGVRTPLAGFVVEPFRVSHDAREPVGLVVEDPLGRRIALIADLGSLSRLAWRRLADLDLVLLEANHDPEMLERGPYPWPLKRRVAGRRGHLSNRDAAIGLRRLVGDRLRWVVPYHLSRTNNTPRLAAAALGEALDRTGCAARLVLSEQERPSAWLEVD